MSRGSPQLKDPLIQTVDSPVEAEAGSIGLQELEQATVDGGQQSTVGCGDHARAMPLFNKRSTGKSGWRLKHHDFLPLTKPDSTEPSEPFKSLVDRANDWLRKTPEVQVKTCEPLTWMDNDVKHLGDSEAMVLTKCVFENAQTHYVRGLRLWLTPRTDGKCQTISYYDVIPETSDNVSSLVSKANKKLERSSYKGRILTIQSVPVAVTNGNAGASETRWSENANDDAPYAYVLRVFYDKEQTTKATIGLKDFVPSPTVDGYEGFDQLTDKANCWLKDQSDILVTNMQSVMVQKEEGPHSQTGSSCFYSIPGLHSQNNTFELFRILRVAYIKPASDSSTDFPIIYPFTYEVFTPQLILPKSGKERMEKMRETFSRVSSFLKSSGADIISSETVMNPMQLVSENAQTPPIGNEIKWLLTLRLYMTDTCGPVSPSQEPASNQFTGKLEFNPAGSSRKSARKKSVEHPGPIFLGRVVTRRYKYRWVVAGLTVFICMTIIVVISVVYSNE